MNAISKVQYANPNNPFHRCGVEGCALAAEHFYIVEGTSGVGNRQYRHVAPADIQIRATREQIEAIESL